MPWSRSGSSPSSTGPSASQSPGRFFEVLHACGALEVLFPELARASAVPQPARYHPASVLDGSGPYSRALAYNHPTLSVSPILNAVTLRQRFRGSNAAVDIITHSRGGLVTRWWREALDLKPAPRGKTIFLGSPLAGTGPAAPANLKHACSDEHRARPEDGEVRLPDRHATIGGGRRADVAVRDDDEGRGGRHRSSMLASRSFRALAGQSRESANAEIPRLCKSFGGVPLVAESRELLDSYYFVQVGISTGGPGVEVPATLLGA